MYTFPNWIATPENRSALEAVRHIADCLATAQPTITPLFLHGPSGCGKTHLVSALAAEVAVRRPGATVAAVTARSLGEALRAGQDASPEQAHERDAARAADLLIVEDVQHLPESAATGFGRLLDFRGVRGRPTVLTGTTGPAQLEDLPVRLTSRLSGGLVVRLEAYGPASRRRLLKALTERRPLAVPADVLDWLTSRVGGSGRQIEGVVIRLEALARLSGGRLELSGVAAHFGDEPETMRPTLERIAEQVGRYFRVKSAQMRSSQRGRRFLVPRQVAMYLARRLTACSLVEIGGWFGGRDHSTVLHACRKVEATLPEDAQFGGVVRALEAELGGSVRSMAG